MRTFNLQNSQAAISSLRGAAFHAFKAADVSETKLKSFPLSSPRVCHAIAVYKQLFDISNGAPITACGEKTATSTIIKAGFLSIDENGLLKLNKPLPDTSAILRTNITKTGDIIDISSDAGKHHTQITLIPNAPASEAQASEASATPAKKTKTAKKQKIAA
jgi:hypothetical protein